MHIFGPEWGILTNGAEFRLYHNDGDPHKAGTLETAALPHAAVLEQLRPQNFK